MSETQPLDSPESLPEQASGNSAETFALPASSDSQQAPEKTRRRRAPKPKQVEVTEAIPDASVEAAADTAPPKRSRSPRRRAAEPAVSASEEAAPAPISDETPATPTRRRGSSRKAAEPTPEASAPTADAPARITRRRGQRVETAEAMPDSPAPEAETVSPTRARGRRRAATPPIVTAAPAETEKAESDVAEGETEASAEETESGSRKRRSRRRRRRGQDDDAVVDVGELVEDAIVLPEDEPADGIDDDTDFLNVPLPTAPVVPTYVAPPLVPPVQAPAAGALLPRVVASVQMPDGSNEGQRLPRLVVDGQAHLPYLFFVNTDAATDGEVINQQIGQAAAEDFHLFSAVMYLPLKNAYGDRSFGATDALIQQILSVDHDAYILPRLQFVPTNYWARTHSGQMAVYSDGTEGDVSLGSTEFWADCIDALEALISHLADPNTPGGDRVIGFHLERGEWFNDPALGPDVSEPNQAAFQNWLHAKYQQTYALRAAWYDGSVTFETAAVPVPGQGKNALKPAKKGDSPLFAPLREGRFIDYGTFASETAAQIIIGLSEAVKTFSEGRLLVSVSYGYTLEFAARPGSGHLALGRVLRSPALDIIAGPNSYFGRGAGSPAAFGAPIDSAALHGKLWLIEDDTKTFLAEAETDDTYNPKINSGADTQAVHLRHFGAALTHKTGITWMDLWGQGWLNSPDIWREMGRLRDQATRWEQIAGQSAAPDVVAFVDEASLATIKGDATGLASQLVLKTRDLLLRSGASVAFHLQSDVLAERVPDAKLYLFLNALRVTTAERTAIREKIQKSGKTLAWLYAPGLFDENGPSPEEIGETVGMTLRLQPWNALVGSQVNETRHPITERLRGNKRLGQEEILNPSYSVSDPQAVALAEYLASGEPSLAAREHASGWKSVFFGEPHLTLDLLRGIYAYAGVTVYDAQDDVTYAAEDGALLVHASYTGQRTLNLPRRACVYDVLEDRLLATDSRSFRVFLRARSSRLFLWGDPEGMAAATGLSFADTEEEVNSAPSNQERAERIELVREETIELIQLTETTVFVPDDALVAETALLTDDLSDDETPDDNTDSVSAPRSRWQRRRAAQRARRESERAARLSEGSPDSSPSANPPLDIGAIMPDLPPRRQSAENAEDAASDDAGE